MPNYDFRTLSFLDFEELVRDLLQAEWGERLETFGPGRDKGIDIRLAKGSGNVIVQAKHWRGSSAAALVRELRKENEKARLLQPLRYVVATSQSMTQDLKRRIVEAMPDVPLVVSDIIGQEDLNNLLSRHPEIEAQHFKLWLASTGVLERILQSGVYNRTASELDIIQRVVPRFVNNQSVQQAESLLDKTGALIISGPPGVGKTTLARMLLWRHAEQGWNIHVVDSVEEAVQVATEGKKRVIFFDDFLGQVRLSADHVRGIDARLPPLLARITTHKDLRFILTTRDYIFSQAGMISPRLDARNLDARQFVLDVGQYTRGIRARILYNHLFFSELEEPQIDSLLADDFYLKIIDHRNFNPRLIEVITSRKYMDMAEGPAALAIQAVLDNPERLWEAPYRRHLSDDAKLLLIATTIAGGGLPMDQLRDVFARTSVAMDSAIPRASFEPRFRDAFREIEGSAITLSDGHVAFANPGLRDFMQRIITGDGLMEHAVSAAANYKELEECHSIAAGARAEHGRNAMEVTWLAALNRVSKNTATTAYQHLSLAMMLYDDFPSDPFLEHVISAIETLALLGLNSDHVSEACQLLEDAASNGLPSEVGERLSEMATRTCAKLLAVEARHLPFEDIVSLTEAIETYGKDPELAKNSIFEALNTYETCNIRDDLTNFDTLSEVEEFEEDYLRFARRRGYDPSEAVSAFQRRKERLFEDDRPDGDGSSFWGHSGEKDMATHEIRSIFESLRSTSGDP
ncbi:hypothetical protein GOZ97_16505 [Agrobacterium vitis]|uniref:nSTAND3 domain-containing NTPase n=1 Tax=Rhizobium/Agrobacterium group TaxID=227290 RepID=UPI0008DBEB18|nr:MULTISPECIES: restriction endonuclease [Rhizobium/Agrobacterium group]MCF1433193.1 hypothetical protein [Allorhizobium ampelinum]MUO91742.1 hypothetical protein [Agrobacterium vitis]MUZ54757.1 hypothetical protein [Agrobacterium vitis]MUZ93029.1 hypothetical protein [Agrobacterium vitis]MVA41449.1 hypothetical protein [Agrobacterium vitis]